MAISNLELVVDCLRGAAARFALTARGQLTSWRYCFSEALAENSSALRNDSKAPDGAETGVSAGGVVGATFWRQIDGVGHSIAGGEALHAKGQGGKCLDFGSPRNIS